MTPEQFAYWLQGFAELQAAPPTQEQWQSIREHLATVFRKVTPPVQQPKVATPGLDELRRQMEKDAEEKRRQAQPSPILWPRYEGVPYRPSSPYGFPDVIC